MIVLGGADDNRRHVVHRATVRHGAPATKTILATLPGLRPIDAGRVDVLTTRVTSKLTRPEVPPLD